ncbi:ABC transporter permease [Candidatus Poribacteria bacterium]
MKLAENAFVGLTAVSTNKLRSFLTMLGIVIGVAAVVGTIAIGEGARTLIMGEIEKVGGRTLFVVMRPGWIKKDGRWMRNPSREFLKLEDAQAIEALAPSVKEVTPEVMTGTQARVGKESQGYLLEATVPSFSESQNWNLDFGRFMSTDDMSTWKKICVIGSKVWEEMFNKINPIGREIKLGSERFTVVGVMEEKGNAFDLDRDREIIVPLTTAQRRFRGNDYVDIFWGKANSYEVSDRAVLEARTILKRRHNNDEFFEIHSVKQFLNEINKIILIIKVMLGGTAFIALVVGGVGIMNIMLVSVTERRAEIGLRKALGAKKRDILFQFLVEAVILCLVGGIVGIMAGFGLGAGLAKIITALIKGADWPATISTGSIAWAVGVSSLIGLTFGLGPAWKAAKLQPVEALRYE